MSLVTEEIRAKSEVYYGDEICQEKAKFFLKEAGLPNGLLPMKDMVEGGYEKESGFVWLKQKKSTTHKFGKIGKLVNYAPEITAYVEVGRIKKLTGVKAKELMMWITVSDLIVDDPPTGKVTFKIPSGLYRSYPVSAFEVDEEVKDLKKNKDVKEGAGVGAVQVKEV